MDNRGFGSTNSDDIKLAEVQPNGHPGTSEEAPRPQSAKTGTANDLRYGIEDTPPWYTCILLGFQHYMTLFGGTIILPYILAPPICMDQDFVAMANLLSSTIFASGVVTLLQTFVGTRLPIVQGGSFSMIAPTYALLALPQYKCPDYNVLRQQIFNDTILNTGNPNNLTVNDVKINWEEIWQPRMRVLTGSIATASIFQVILGFTGLLGLLLRFIGPLSIAPTIALVGLSLFGFVYDFCSKQWWVALGTAFLITLFSQYMHKLQIPCFTWSKKGCKSSKFALFALFPILLATAIIWLICYILTITNVFSPVKTDYGYEARTDVRGNAVTDSAWFRFPYPGQFGLPEVHVAGFFGMLAGTIASIVESIGDYYACANLSGAPPPPIHAMNRGIGIEGVGSIISALFGCANGLTSYSENIGAMGITKVGSRRVIQVGGLLAIIFGLLSKFGGVFVCIPDPVIGGMFLVMFGMIAAVGMSNLQFIDMNSTRNLYILGTALMCGIAIPEWMKYSNNNKIDPINTGNDIVDSIIVILLSTPMFVGGGVGFILDNTIPGTLEERGILQWRNTEETDSEGMKSYDFPIGMDLVRKVNCFKYLPFCPTFKPEICCKKRKVNDVERNGEIREPKDHS